MQKESNWGAEMMESRPDIQPDEQPEVVTASSDEFPPITPEELAYLECVPDEAEIARWVAWEDEIYPRICNEATRLGQIARESGLPRVCNLGEEYQTPSGEFLTVYLQKWMLGYDGLKPV
jgi:hypothetical protein